MKKAYMGLLAAALFSGTIPARSWSGENAQPEKKAVSEVSRAQPPDSRLKKPADKKGKPAKTGTKETVMEWKGAYCDRKKPEALIADSKTKWDAVWREAFGEKAPAMDFSKHVVAAVFMGEKNTGGYAVEFLEPRIKDGKTIIPYKLKSPAKGAFVIQSFTQPYLMKAFEKGKLPVLLEEEK